MMQNTQLFRQEGVLYNSRVTSQKQLFQEIATRILTLPEFEGTDIACRDIVSAAMERERLGSTGVGNGVALPHARIEGIKNVVAIFATLETPLDFDAIDDRSVDLVTFLLAPEDAGGAHLRALAKVSRLMRRQDVRARLRAAPSSEALYAIIAEHQTTSTAA